MDVTASTRVAPGEVAPAERTAFHTCPLCEANCGLEIRISADRVRVRGDEQDVLSHGFVCPKGVSIHESDTNPDRLRWPLIRDRATGQHREVSWQEAFEHIERGLAPVLASGDPDGVGFYYGTGSGHSAGGLYFGVLSNALPTKNRYGSSTVDQAPKQVACALMFGHSMTVPIPDIDHCGYLLILGANPAVSNGSLFTAPGVLPRMKALRQRGGRIVVVDPRRTRTAQEADEHVPLRPGTDALLLAAMAQVLFDENLVRLGRLAEHVEGVEEVRAAVQAFTPERVAGHCGVPAPTIRRLARELAAARAGAVYGRIGTSAQLYGTLASWLVDVLNVLTGNLDRRGGVMFPKAAVAQANSAVRGAPVATKVLGTPTRVRGLPSVNIIGGFERPAVCLAEEIETPGRGQLRALFTVGCNPVLSVPEGPRLARALETLDFMVSVDPFLNETTRHADVVLPPPPDLAKPHYPTIFMQWSTRNAAKWSPAVRPLAEHEMDEGEIFLRLTNIVQGRGASADPGLVDDQVFNFTVKRALGSADPELAGLDEATVREAMGERRGPERMIDFMLRAGPWGDKFGRRPDGLSLQRLEQQPHGVDLGPLQPRVPEVLMTMSGKIELAPPQILADLPRLEAALAQPRPDGELLLIGRRDIRSKNSYMHNVDELMTGKSRCTLMLHPDDARRHGLTDGGWASVATALGELTVPVEVSDEVMPGVVSLPHGWGHLDPLTRQSRAQRTPGVNVNTLVSGELIDPLSGNAAINGVPVTVRPAECEPAR